MKIISGQVHAALDYVTVVIFALAPSVVGLSSAAANEDRDAEGIAEAVTPPTMRFVELK
jgi:hypothetical protein